MVTLVDRVEFQSPQWGDCSKERNVKEKIKKKCFSPRNGEIVLKGNKKINLKNIEGFSPRNGEIVLKNNIEFVQATPTGFSPRNGEIVLKS